MKINKITNYINDIVFGIFGIIDLLLILRIMLKLIAASTKSSFVNLVYNSTEGFVNVFEGTIGNIQAGNLILEIDTFIAVFVYFAIGLGLFKLLQAAFEKESYEKIRLALDTLFKVGEVTLGMRFFFKLVGAGDSKFIKILYDISGVFYKPFEGLLPSADADKFIFETATLVAIIIIIIIDIVTENLFKETKKRHIDIKEEEVKIKTNTETKPEQPQSIPVQNPSPTNIVIENQKPSTPVIKQQKPKLKTQIIKILEEKDGQSAIIEIDKILSPIFYKNPNELTRAEKILF